MTSGRGKLEWLEEAYDNLSDALTSIEDEHSTDGHLEKFPNCKICEVLGWMERNEYKFRDW